MLTPNQKIELKIKIEKRIDRILNEVGDGDIIIKIQDFGHNVFLSHSEKEKIDYQYIPSGEFHILEVKI